MTAPSDLGGSVGSAFKMIIKIILLWGGLLIGAKYLVRREEKEKENDKT